MMEVLCLSDLIHLTRSGLLFKANMILTFLILFKDDLIPLLADNCVLTSLYCGLSDRPFVLYKMGLTSWTCSPAELLLTSTLLLSDPCGLVTSAGQRGVNPLLLQTPATVNSGVIHWPVWWGGDEPSVCTKRLVWCLYRVQRLYKRNLRHTGYITHKRSCAYTLEFLFSPNYV